MLRISCALALAPLVLDTLAFTAVVSAVLIAAPAELPLELVNLLLGAGKLHLQRGGRRLELRCSGPALPL